MTVTFTDSKGKRTASMRSSLVDAVHQFGQKVTGEPLRRAAAAGALVLYEEMVPRVPVRTGTLKDSIYRYWLRRDGNAERQTYVVGPNKAKAPHWHLVEYGHMQLNGAWVPAQPYIRPAFDARAADAVQAMRTEFGRAIDEAKTA